MRKNRIKTATQLGSSYLLTDKVSSISCTSRGASYVSPKFDSILFLTCKTTFNFMESIKYFRARRKNVHETIVNKRGLRIAQDEKDWS